METFALEIVLMLLAAYTLGCLVGHFARDLFGPSTSGLSGSGGQRSDRRDRKDRSAGRTRSKSRSKPSRDDLTRIKGIGPAIEKKLNRLGIKRFEQIAGWDMADVAVFDQRLTFHGRIERENWIAQARKLASRKS